MTLGVITKIVVSNEVILRIFFLSLGPLIFAFRPGVPQYFSARPKDHF